MPNVIIENVTPPLGVIHSLGSAIQGLPPCLALTRVFPVFKALPRSSLLSALPPVVFPPVTPVSKELIDRIFIFGLSYGAASLVQSTFCPKRFLFETLV